jgi:anti-anti-sigma regulatory factor
MSKSGFVVQDKIAGTRRHAERLRQEIERQLAHATGQKFEIDLTGVYSMSDAFADELAGRLLSEQQAAWPHIVFVTDDDRVRGKLQTVLERRGLVAWLSIREAAEFRPLGMGASQ